MDFQCRDYRQSNASHHGNLHQSYQNTRRVGQTIHHKSGIGLSSHRLMLLCHFKLKADVAYDRIDIVGIRSITSLFKAAPRAYMP
jgi:hypothetical protein